MGMKGTRGGASEPAVVLEKKQAVLLMCRILGAYYAEKGYAVSRECGVPTLSKDQSGKVWERIGNPQRADFIAINKVLLRSGSVDRGIHQEGTGEP